MRNTVIYGKTKYWLEVQGIKRDCFVIWDFNYDDFIEQVELGDSVFSSDDLKNLMGDPAYRKFYGNIRAIVCGQVADFINKSDSSEKIIPIEVK